MNLEQQVISLDLATRLKEFGLKQDSLFYWETAYEHAVIRPFKEIENNLHFHSDLYFPAFTASELLEILPCYIDDEGCLKIEKHDVMNEGIKYFVEYGYGYYELQDASLSNALAKMLIYLHDNGLIKNDK